MYMSHENTTALADTHTPTHAHPPFFLINTFLKVSNDGTVAALAGGRAFCCV